MDRVQQRTRTGRRRSPPLVLILFVLFVLVLTAGEEAVRAPDLILDFRVACNQFG